MQDIILNREQQTQQARDRMDNADAEAVFTFPEARGVPGTASVPAAKTIE